MSSQPIPTTLSKQTTKSLYSVSSVGVTYGKDVGCAAVIDDVSFDVAEREIIAVVGRSGTGKTTLLRTLGGLLQATTGGIEFAGAPLRGTTDGVITVFQDYTNALLPWRTVANNIALPLERRLSKAERQTRIAEVLRMVGMEDKAGLYPWELSGGMQQRVQIARALALQPRVLLMDEPFGALDAMTKGTLQDELLRVQHETGATIIFITHDLEEAIYLSDRVLVIAGSPGTITVDIPVGLPRPRQQITTREDPRYLGIRHRLSEAIHEP